MKRLLLCGLLLSLAAFPANPPKVDLSSVHSIFIEGNNQAAEAARAELQKGKSCFALAQKAEDSDAVLALQADSSSPSMGIMDQRSWVTSATLTLKSGDLVWSASERFIDTPFKSGGKTTGKLLIKRLVRDSGCKKR